MSRPNNWHDHWLDVDCAGHPLREWCTNSTKEPGFAHCRVCNLTLKYLNIGVRALKDHGKSKKHLDNWKAIVDSSINNPNKISSVSHVPTDGKQKRKSLPSNFKTTKCNNNQQSQKRILSPNSTDFKPCVNQAVDARHGPVPYYQLYNNELRNVLIPVYPCCFCPEEFSSKQLLHDHQTSCIMKPPVLQAVTPSDSLSLPNNAENNAPPSISPLMGDSLLKVSTPLSLSQHLRQSKTDFISHLGLLPKKKARQVSERRRNTECENIDWEEVPITPTTPGRTPKSLMSHLSRDCHDYQRRRLSFNVDGKLDKESEANQENGTESQGEEQKKMTVCKSLYNLDVTSPLGQFVIKHFKGDPSLHILSDIESHCLTLSATKNSSTSRLRVRYVTYPITFRGYSGKYGGNYAHQYKFNKKEVKEFMKTVSTGLNKKSRYLMRQMRPCKVIIKRVTKADLRYWIPSQNHITIDLKPLSASEIAFWTMPKPSSLDSVSEFPNGLKFTSPNVNTILGLQTRKDHTNHRLQTSSLSLSNFVSEEVCAELIQNRKVLYRSLLSDCSIKDACLSGIENPPPPTNHATSHSVLRHMLNQAPIICDAKSTQKLSRFPLIESNISGQWVSKESMNPKKRDSRHFSDALEFMPTQFDVDLKQSIESPSSFNLPAKKIKLSSPASFDISTKIKFEEKEETKILGGFSVRVKCSFEGDRIKKFNEMPEETKAFVNKLKTFEEKKRQTVTYLNGKGNSEGRLTLNGISSRRKTLRSSVKLPVSRQGKSYIKGNDKIVHLRKSTKISAKLNSKRRIRLKSNNSKDVNLSLKKESLEQRKIQFQQSKPCLTSNNAQANVHKDGFNHTGESSKKVVPSSNESSAILKRRLSAAGLVKRDSIPLTKPSPPVLSQPFRLIEDKSVSNKTCAEGNASCEKKASQNSVLRKSKSVSSASPLNYSYRHGRRSMQRLKEEKHKSFLMWLKNLRKGNIT